MTTSNPSPQPEPMPQNEGNDPKSGENDNPKAVTGAIEGGWNGSVAGTNDALEPDDDEPTER